MLIRSDVGDRRPQRNDGRHLIRDGKAKEVRVAVGAQAGGRSQILCGLSPGDTVATKGGYGLPDGYPVEIVTHPTKTK